MSSDRIPGPPRYFIAAIGKDHPGTWERCKELGSWGSPNHSKLMESVRVGDQVLFWQGGQGFMATAAVTGPFHIVTPTPENEWHHDGKVYPYRFPLEPVKEFAVPLKPAFPGTAPDPEFGVATLQLKSGFAEISVTQFEAIVGKLESLNASQSWMVLQAPGSLYRDVEGVAYHYPLRIPNARRIRAGDVIVVCRPAKQVDDGGRLIGLGRVGSIEDEGTEASAFYDRYLALSPGRSFEEVGGDPRNNQTNSINTIPHAFVERLLRLLGLESVDDLPSVDARLPRPPQPPRPPAPGTRMTFEELLEKTLWDEAALRQLVEAVSDTSPQVALAGPPGTSKTWLALLIAEFLVQGRHGAVTMVQFHPSYAYEQFIEGLRPVVKNGGIAFEMVPGVVPSIVDQMRRDPGLHVLLIDEMNRANLPKVFGELMFLFEYREKAIDLQYSKEFSLPRGLRFIGTMNTADRSIRSIDVALRRRFDVFDCPPDRGILERYYERIGQNEVADLIGGFDKLNAELEAALDRHHTIGHAFLMAKLMDASRLRFVWTHKIAPLVDEYFFDQPDLAASFRLDTYWPSAK